MRKIVKWGFGPSVQVEIILRGADRSVLARNIESVALRPCQVARDAEISKQNIEQLNKNNKPRKSKIGSPLLLSAHVGWVYGIANSGEGMLSKGKLHK